MTETANPDFDQTSVSCSDGTNTLTNTSFAVPAGGLVTCTFTNTKKGQIKIVKSTVGGEGTFSFSATGPNSFSQSPSITTSGGSGTTQPTFTVSAASGYSVTETANPNFDLTSVSCSDGTNTLTNTSFAVPAGGLVTCTFTNTKKGHLIVQKTTDPAGATTVFTINASGTGTITGGGAGTVTDALDMDYEVTPGTYSVTETVPAGWIKTGDTCQNVVVAAGQTKTCTITNTNRGTTTIVGVSPASVQYSDKVTFSAVVSTLCTTCTGFGLPTGTIEFKVNGTSVASGVSLADAAAGVLVQILTPAGSYTVTAIFTPTNLNYLGSTSLNNPTLTVTKEYVNLDYTGDSARTISGGNVTFQMNAALTESDTDYGTQLGTVSVLFTLKDGGSTVSTCVSTVSTASQPPGKAVTTPGCTIPVVTSLATLYDVEMSLVTNSYYSGSGLGSAAAILAVPGRTTGGFWIYEPLTGGGVGDRVNGGINATYQDSKKQTGAKGNANIVRRAMLDLSTLHPSLPSGVADYNFHIKSNATQQFTITCSGTPPNQVCTSTLVGKATVKAVNRATGITYDVGAALGGNVSFQIDVTDAGEPGSAPAVGPDKVAARVWNAGSSILILDSEPISTYTSTKQILLNGGNIQVRP